MEKDDGRWKNREEKMMCQWEAGLQTTCPRIGRSAFTVLQQPLSAAAATALERVCVCLCLCVSVCMCVQEGYIDRAQEINVYV